VLEGKDREQLIAIATALGLKALSRAKKGEIIDRILEQTGAAPAAGTLGSSNGNGSGGVNGAAPAAAQQSSTRMFPSIPFLRTLASGLVAYGSGEKSPGHSPRRSMMCSIWRCACAGAAGSRSTTRGPDTSARRMNSATVIH
jgi:hypothetical protein